MSSTAVVVPIKSLAEAKQRLAAENVVNRSELMLAMATDVLKSILDSNVRQLFLVTDDASLCDLATGLAVLGGDASRVVLVADPHENGHSGAAAAGARCATDHGFQQVVMLAADCPLLTAATVNQLIVDRAERFVGVIPDRHDTGTNGLVLSPSDAIEPAFGPGSKQRHLDLAQLAGITGTVIKSVELAIDADTVDDIAALRQAINQNSAVAPSTRVALAGVSVK